MLRRGVAGKGAVLRGGEYAGGMNVVVSVGDWV